MLVTGAAGTLKSGFYISATFKLSLNNRIRSTRITLEQSRENHLHNMESMGTDLSKKLHISDFSDYRVMYDDFSDDLAKDS
ncbi:MAG: hypothetical protein R2741_12110 [Methanolobus sp.]